MAKRSARGSKYTERALRVLRRGGAITAAVLPLLAASATATSLSGSIGGGAKFPDRSLVLSAPAGIPVTVPHVYVSENGKPVDHLSVTPMKAAGAGGIMLVIDQSESMRGAALTHAMAAARAIAAQRTGKQELGVITFDSAPSVVLPMTSDPATINRALARTPWTGVGTGPLRALMTGLHQLAYAHIADGTVILLSDGAANGASKLTPTSLGAAALALHARIFTVGIGDRSFAPGLMRQIARRGGGKFVLATGAQLPPGFTRLATALPQSYLVRYQSILSGSQHVAVTVHVDGVANLLDLSYEAPALAPGSTTSGSGRSATTPSGTVSAAATGSGRKPSGSASHASTTPKASSGATTDATTTPSPGTLPSWWHALSLPLPAHHRASTGHGPIAAPAVRASVLTAVPAVMLLPPAWAPPAGHPSFWTTSLAVVLIGGICAVLIGLAITVLLLRRPARRALQRRVGSFTLASATDATVPVLTTTGPDGPLARLLARRRWWPAFAERVETARMKRSPVALVKRSAVISVVAAFLVAIVSGSVLPGVLLLIVAPFIVRTLVARGARRQQSRFNEQLPSHLQDLGGALRAGRSFVGGIDAMVDSAGEPIRGEFERALSDERLGLPLEETLEAIGRRMAAKDMEQVALIASLNRKSGSNVAEALDRVAESARERAELRREMKSLTGQARMSAYVLTGMPPALLLALTVMAPQYQRPLFHTTMGIVLLIFSVGLLAAGWMVMNKIINPEA